MSGKMARNKGQRGEREIASLLARLLDRPVSRNLDQVRNGGYDINEIDGFAFEVKRCQSLSLQGWWTHLIDGLDPALIPVVAYRQNRQPWRFLLPCSALLSIEPIHAMEIERSLDPDALRDLYSPYLAFPEKIEDLITIQWPIMGNIIINQTLKLERESVIYGESPQSANP